MPRGASTALLAIVCASAIGCREELGPSRPPSARVGGRVSFRGAPIGGGWIEFHPIDGALGDIRSAPLNRDGTFVADRVAIGRNAVRLAHPTIVPRSPAIATLRRLPVAVQTIERDGQVLDIDLARELRRPRPDN